MSQSSQQNGQSAGRDHVAKPPYHDRADTHRILITSLSHLRANTEPSMAAAMADR